MALEAIRRMALQVCFFKFGCFGSSQEPQEQKICLEVALNCLKLLLNAFKMPFKCL